ncbi:MAG: FAD:protein FMN transferase [Fuerstia sp.]|nr:FAD:protein FMN transferase [Fuerstiella sp.]
MVLFLNNPRRAFLSVVILLCAAITARAETLKLNGKTMGSYYAISIDGAAESDAAEIQKEIEAVLADVNRQMSTWDPESEISKFNQSDSTDWFSVSPEFAMVVTESIRIHKLTGGAFDPTVAPLIELWGFGAKRQKSFPTQEAIDAARGNTGMKFIDVRQEPPSIRRTRPGITLNLSALAPGHGTDRLCERLTKLGYPSHVVDIGGEVRTGITKANGEKWRLGVESPLGGIQRVIECSEMSVSTSGNYRNYFEYKGVRYSHTIDPTTGQPVMNPPASVSVLSDSCMTADGLATGLMVMGIERGLQFAQQQGLSVLFLDVVDEETVVEHATGEFLPGVGPTIPDEATLAVFLLALTATAIVLFRRTWSETSSV